MSLDAITLDAAGTLVQVDWHPGRVAWESAEAIGLELDRETAAARFDRALQARWKAYRALNQTRDADALEHLLPPAILAQLESRLAQQGRLPVPVPSSPHTVEPHGRADPLA